MSEPSKLPPDLLKKLRSHLAENADRAMTCTIAGQPIGPSEPLTAINMAQRILDALAPNDHWQVRPDALMPIGAPVVRMTNDNGVREHHIGASAALLMATKQYCPWQIIDVDAARLTHGIGAVSV